MFAITYTNINLQKPNREIYIDVSDCQGWHKIEGSVVGVSIGAGGEATIKAWKHYEPCNPLCEDEGRPANTRARVYYEFETSNNFNSGGLSIIAAWDFHKSIDDWEGCECKPNLEGNYFHYGFAGIGFHLLLVNLHIWVLKSIE